MRLKVELNNGEVHVVTDMRGNDPKSVDGFGYGPFAIDDTFYHQDGRFANINLDQELSVKRIISRADDTPEPDYNYAEQDAKHGVTITVELIDANVIVFDGKK